MVKGIKGATYQASQERALKIEISDTDEGVVTVQIMSLLSSAYASSGAGTLWTDLTDYTTDLSVVLSMCLS